MSLPSFSVRNHVLVNILMLVILVAGIVFAITLQREMFPESRPDKLMISAVYPGVQPEDVEKSVTIKIEEAVRSLEGIDKVESQVAEGVSFTTLTLDQSVDDVDVMLQEIRNEVDSIQDIPDGVEKISLRKVEPQLPVISIAIYSDETEASLKRTAQALRDDLLKLPGISRVELNGIRDDEIYVDVQPEKLMKYDVTFEEIAAAIRSENLDISGGQLKGDRSSIAVRTLGEEQEALSLESIVVRSQPDGQQIYLSDVATLSDGFVDSDLQSLFNAKPSINCVIFNGDNEDAVQISAVVKAYFAGRSGGEYTGPGEGLSKAYSVIGRPDVFAVYQQSKSRPFPEAFRFKLHTDIARFVEGRLDLMTRNGRMGLILVLISLNLFLNWRVAFWAAVGLVVSFMGTFAVMWLLGASVNLLSMFGLIIVLGIIVDDAIVIGENIYRHVEEGMPAMEAAVKGAEEVMWPVIVAVSTTIGAFAPLFFIQGQIGDFMAQLPLVVIAALSISLVEALVILPAHLRHLPAVKKRSEDGAPHARGIGGFKEMVLKKFLQAPYEKLLLVCLKWRYVTMASVVAACFVAAGMMAGGIVKWQFIQDMDSESVICALEMPIGTSTERLQEELQKLTDFIVSEERFPEIVNVQTIAGRQYDVTGAGSVGFDDQSHLGQLIVEICPAEERTRSSKALVNALRDFSSSQLTGVNSVKWEAMNGGPGGNDIEISVSGVDDDQLPKAIADIKEIAGMLQGVYDLDDNLDIGKKELRLTLRDSAASAGVTVASLGAHVRGALFGQEAKRISRNREDVRIMVRYPESFRESNWNVESMWIPGRVASNPMNANAALSASMNNGSPASGSDEDMSQARKWIPIRELAEINRGIGYSTISRYQQTRSAKVTGAVDYAVVPSTSSVVDAIRAKVAAEVLPKYPGIDIQYLGQAEEMRKSFSSLQIAFPIALLIIYGMLAGLFRSYTQPLVVMSAIPFGFLGAVIGHWITGETFTILSAIGLVALAGILVNDSLVLVDFINRRVQDGLSPFDASVDGAKKRLRAILLTTLTTAAGLMPLMFETSFQAKFLVPMAVTLTFGLLFATGLTLVLVPCLNLIREDLEALVYRRNSN